MNTFKNLKKFGTALLCFSCFGFQPAPANNSTILTQFLPLYRITNNCIDCVSVQIWDDAQKLVFEVDVKGNSMVETPLPKCGWFFQKIRTDPSNCTNAPLVSSIMADFVVPTTSNCFTSVFYCETGSRGYWYNHNCKPCASTQK